MMGGRDASLNVMRTMILLPRPRAMWAMRHSRARQKYLRVYEDRGGGDDDGGAGTPPLMRPMNAIAKVEDGGDEDGIV